MDKQVERLLSLTEKLLDIHSQVVMDTPEDRALHDRAVQTFRHALDIERRLAEEKGEDDS